MFHGYLGWLLKKGSSSKSNLLRTPSSISSSSPVRVIFKRWFSNHTSDFLPKLPLMGHDETKLLMPDSDFVLQIEEFSMIPRKADLPVHGFWLISGLSRVWAKTGRASDRRPPENYRARSCPDRTVASHVCKWFRIDERDSALLEALGLPNALARARVNLSIGVGYADLITQQVVNRLCDPCSKLALLDWLDGVWLSGFEQHRPACHHLLHVTNRFPDAKETLKSVIAARCCEHFGFIPSAIPRPPWSQMFVSRILFEWPLRQNAMYFWL